MNYQESLEYVCCSKVMKRWAMKFSLAAKLLYALTIRMFIKIQIAGTNGAV